MVAVCFLAAGLVALRSRGHARIGMLLAAVGLFWVAAKLLPLDGLRVALVGGWAAALAHLVVAYPTGRLVGPAPRAVVGLAYTSAAAVGLVGFATGDPDLVRGVAMVAVVASGLAVVGLQAVRWRRSTAARRHLESPFVAAAIVAAAAFVSLKPALIAGAAVRPVVDVVLASVPLAYLVGLLWRRIDRAGLADLVVRLTDGSHPAERALADALHDPTVTVGYWVEESRTFVDIDGRAVNVRGAATGGRAATRIDRDGAPLAVLVHDPALLAERDLIGAACAAAGLALANDCLTAELRARVRQLTESRAQVIRAAEEERRRLERDLHDGVQQRLLAIPMMLGRAEVAVRAYPERAESLIAEAKTTTLAVLAELRALAQGVHPPMLTERGLQGAVRELAALAPVPLDLVLDLPRPVPADVESVAYYVVAEGLANLARHAAARRARVRVTWRSGRLAVEVDDDGRGGADPREGSGLRGLADRVVASGGAFDVDSPPGAGTRIRAVLPCG
jgi:signal transduction histidine kinase